MAAIAIKNEAEWLSVREQYVGGSEIASLFYSYELPDGSTIVRHAYEDVPADAVPLGCLSHFQTAYGLYNEKAGIVMPEDFSSERIDAGRFMEPALAEWSKHKFKWPIRKVRRYLSHETVEGWGASLDFEIHGDGHSGVPVEFKNVDFLIFQKDWLVDHEEILAPPIHYSLQLQHQMGATGADHGYIVACVAGNKLCRGRIERHEPTQKKIAEAIESFWHHVRAGIPPTRVADYPSVAKAYAFGDKESAIDLSATEGINDLIDQYLADKEALEKLEVKVENGKGRIAEHLGTNGKATGAGFRISWPVINRKEKVIPERVQAALTYRGALTIVKEAA